jgi:hypothetical protein
VASLHPPACCHSRVSYCFQGVSPQGWDALTLLHWVPTGKSCLWLPVPQQQQHSCPSAQRGRGASHAQPGMNNTLQGPICVWCVPEGDIASNSVLSAELALPSSAASVVQGGVCDLVVAAAGGSCGWMVLQNARTHVWWSGCCHAVLGCGCRGACAHNQCRQVCGRIRQLAGPLAAGWLGGVGWPFCVVHAVLRGTPQAASAACVGRQASSLALDLSVAGVGANAPQLLPCSCL